MTGSLNRPASGRRLIKRACDGCKIRKIKCSENPPCNGCVAVKIPCTFNRHVSARGPRHLRKTTLNTIAEAQREGVSQPTVIPVQENAAPRHVSPLEPPQSIEPSPGTPIASLVFELCVYRLRLFPVWPIIKVEEVIASLHRNKEDMEAYALANAVGAATIAQLKLPRSTDDANSVTGASMEAECQRARSLREPQVNLDNIRMAFFLHVYHENQDAGGTKSLLYLREALTMAQIMGLHRESTYSTLPSNGQQRRRILWLLFVTERGVAMLHKLPVCLKPSIAFPSIGEDDEASVLPAFQKLVNLFWIFDQSGAFDILQNSDDIESTGRACLAMLQKKLREVPLDSESMNDVQRADICVTRQWMRAVLWRAESNHGLLSSKSNNQLTSLSYPVQIAKEFLDVISQLPASAIEAHGPSMELKIYDIASSVTDAILNGLAGTEQSWNLSDQPKEILYQLHRIFSSSRSRDDRLVSMFCNKIAEAGCFPQMLIEPSSRVVEEVDEPWSLGSDGTSEAAFLCKIDFLLNENQPHQFLGNTNMATHRPTAVGAPEITQNFECHPPPPCQWGEFYSMDQTVLLDSSTGLYDQLQSLGALLDNTNVSTTIANDHCNPYESMSMAPDPPFLDWV